MKSIGWLLVILGAGSFLLNLIDMEFKYLMWIDNWGVEIGWAIRGAMIVVGGALLFFGMKSDVTAAAPAAPTEPAPPAEAELPEPQEFDPQLSAPRE